MIQTNTLRVVNKNFQQRYLEWYLLFKNPSEDTKNSARLKIRAMVSSPIFSGKEFNFETALAYTAWLKRQEDEGVFKRNTVYDYAKILRSVCDFLATTDPTFASFKDKLPTIKRIDTPIFPLSSEEIELIIKAPVTERQRQPDMYQLLIALLAQSGRRVTEIRKLKVKDMDFSNSLMQIHAKGGAYQWIPIPGDLSPRLRQYSLYKGEESYLFTRLGRNTPLSRQSITREIRTRAKEVGIKKRVYSHLLRHSYPREMLNNKVDITLVQRLLGHTSIVTTMRYLHLVTEDIQEASMFHPLNQKALPPQEIANAVKREVNRFRGIKREDLNWKVVEEKGKLLIELTWK